jgi:DNA-binding GntR family transcriptional regulator
MSQKKQILYQTMTQIATAQIKDAILNGIYQPGAKIVPAQLEKDLELGKAAIRDALRELTGTGLLVNMPNKATVVAGPISREEIIEVFEIRYLLEGKAAFKATQEMTTESIQELEAINEKLKKVPRSYSNEYFIINKEFHLKLYENSGWSFLFRIIEQLFDQIRLYRLFYPFEPEGIEMYLGDHIKILNALKARNPAEVQKRLVSHIKKGFKNIMKLHKQKLETKES